MNIFKAHPWHGVSLGEDQPFVVNVFIEVTPSDTVKYELDKETGILKVDRPQLFSNVCPTLYGMLPRTFCGDRVAMHYQNKLGREGIVGDKDPLDICVLTEKLVPHGDMLLKAIPIGGLALFDNDEADDKIIAVLKDDALYGKWEDISQCPQSVLERLEHYFLTYKNAPGSKKNKCQLMGVYGREEAHEIIKLAYEDYKEMFFNTVESHNRKS